MNCSNCGHENREAARFGGTLSDASSRELWLREAYRLFTEMGATGHAERVGRELAAAAE